MRKRHAYFLALFVATAVACGSRTGLLVPEEPIEDVDAGLDAGLDAGRDASRDVSLDRLPMVDVVPRPDVQRNDCPDASATLIYVVTESNDLYSFDPPTAQFKRIGTIACPAGPGATPFSMAVDRKGIARVVFNDGELFRVSTATAACQATPFIPQPSNTAFHEFGMAFVTDDTGGGETLFIASDTLNGGPPAQLGSIDSNYVLHRVGLFNPELHAAELTGTGDGRLFGFDAINNTDPSSTLVQIDKATADVIGATNLPGVSQGSGWAFAFWGGDFYFFTGPSGSSSIVQRYRPSDGTIVQVGSLPSLIVGAGVSTCAPEM